MPTHSTVRPVLRGLIGDDLAALAALAGLVLLFFAA